MPDLSALELCRQIRVLDQTTPILFCSGGTLQADIEAATLASAQEYISKPFDPDDLTRILRWALIPNKSVAK